MPYSLELYIIKSYVADSRKGYIGRGSDEDCGLFLCPKCRCTCKGPIETTEYGKDNKLSTTKPGAIKPRLHSFIGIPHLALVRSVRQESRAYGGGM